MVRRHLPPLGPLLAVVALLVAPVRGTVACDLVSAEHGAFARHERSPSPSATDAMAHTAHAGHQMLVEGDPEAPLRDMPASVPMPCDDWASCVMTALPQVALGRTMPSIPAAAPRIALASAPDAPVLTVEPPPPRD